jgi:hypothetical protein
MRRSPSITPPPPDDQDVYLVLDDFGGRLGRAWRESREERTSRDTVIADLMDGQFFNPVRVIVFNTASGNTRDVSREFAELIVQEYRCDGFDVPSFLRGFIERHRGDRPAQLILPLSRKS